MRTALTAGRDFTPQDTDTSPRVAIVNREFAERYWPHQDAIGRRIRYWDQWFAVVGVAGNGKYRRLVYASEPVVFLPLFQTNCNSIIIHARVAGEPRAFASAIEQSVHQLNADLPVFNVTNSGRACSLEASLNGSPELSPAHLACSR
jgi:hypothetical protein